jgi:hypothetical protein
MYLAFDVMLGTFLVRLLATRQVMSVYEAARLVDVVVAGLRGAVASRKKPPARSDASGRVPRRGEAGRSGPRRG